MYNVDHPLFLALNFDGGELLDRLMVIISGTAVWIPFYILIMWLVWRRAGWKNTMLFLIAMVLALVMTDMIAGIFKHVGLLKNLLPDFPPRLRPMYTPELEGMVHVVKLGGMYGTVSAHAATVSSVALLSAAVVRRRWFSVVAVMWVLLICYSRIYLAYHFPLDIAWGVLLGVAMGWIMFLLYKKFRFPEQASR